MYTEDQLVSIGEGKYLPINVAAPHIKMSDRSLRRECAKKNVEYMRYKNQLYFKPEWLEDLLQRHIVKPRKTLR